MKDTPAATEPIALPLAAQLAGIPARTLRNWVAGGKLAAIRGQRGWLVRLRDIEQIAAMLGTDAAGAATVGGMAAGLAVDLAARGAESGQDAATAATAAMQATDQREQAEALVQRLLAPFIAELGTVREELGMVKAERDALRRRAAAAEAELARRCEPPPPTVDLLISAPTRAQDATTGAGSTPEASGAPAPADGLWGRLGRWWRGT